MAAEPICPDRGGDKAKTVTASYFKYAPSDSFKKANPRMEVAEGTVGGVKPLSEKEMDYMVRDHLEHRWAHCNKPDEEDKSKCVVANYTKGVPYNVAAEKVKGENNE